MPLPSFTVTGNAWDLLGNTSGGEIVGNGLGGANPVTVRFVSNANGMFVVWNGQLYRVNEIVATVNTAGQIVRNGEPVQLLANDAGLNVDDLQWQIEIGGQYIWFNAPTDGATLDVAGIVPATPLPVQADVTSLPVSGLTDASNYTKTFLTSVGNAIDARAYFGIDLTDLDEWEWFANFAAFPGTGVTDVVYGARDTEFIYRWSGSTYVQVGGNDPAGIIHAATSKTNPVDADEIGLVDSGASFALKKLTWANLKAAIKTYYDAVASTLSSKSISLTTNTVTGTVTEFNTALQSADFYTTGGTDVAVADGGTGASTASAARTNLGLVIGTDVSAAGAVPASLVDAKGDLFVGTADNIVARLPVGSNTQVLTADSTQTGGVKWAAAGASSITVSMPAPSGDKTGATDTAALTAAQALLPYGRGGIVFGGGVYWMTGDCGNIPTGQHWYGQGTSATIARLAAGQNGNFVRTKGWATYSAPGFSDIITATKTGCATTANSNVITMSSTSSIAVGDLINCAGFINGTYVQSIVTNVSVTVSSDASATASGLTAKFSSVPMDYGIHNMTLDGNGYFAFNTANQLAPPTGLAVTPAGTTGSTFYSYRVTAYNAIGETQGSANVTISNGNATLTGTNKNSISWSARTGATGYKVYRSKYDVLGSELLLATVTSGTSYQDTSITDPNTGPLFQAPMTNSTGGRVLATYGYGETLENVDIANGAGVGWESGGLGTATFNFGVTYNRKMTNVELRANQGGGMRLGGPTDIIWTGASFNANGVTGGTAATNGLVDLDVLISGLSIQGYHFYGGGVQSGLRLAGSLNTLTDGQLEDGFSFLCITTGNFNRVEGHAYNVSAGVDTPVAFYAGGLNNRVAATVQNTAGGVIKLAAGESGGDYKFQTGFWTITQPSPLIIGLPANTTSSVKILGYDSTGVGYLVSTEAAYEIRSASTKTTPADDDVIAVVESGWPYPMKKVSISDLRSGGHSVLAASITQTLAVGRPAYVFTGGSTVTWTLPAIAGNTGEPLAIKNRGSAALTLASASGSQIYNTAAQTTISVAAGASVRLVNDGTYWAAI